MIVKLRVFFLVLAFLSFTSSTWYVPAKDPFLQKTTVWEERENGLFAHFVYGLTVTQKGSILAFAEARISDGSDDGAHHIVMKRSTDQGASFSTSKVIVESKNGECWANPTVVADKKTKEIFLFYALNHKNESSEVFYKSSKDDGLSWSAAKSITALFDEKMHGWTFHLPGPGHGIQLHNNRLVIPIWHRKAIAFAAKERNYGVNCIYSDDHGKSWKAGNSSPIGELNESQIVTQQNGDLLLIGRTIHANGQSYQAKVWSKDGGESWSTEPQYDVALAGKACDIGLINYSPTAYLISQPAAPKQRKALTIRMSNDEGKTWPIARLLEPGSSTYSDLAILPDKTIVCLYGNGGEGHMPKQVSLARFNLKWLVENPK